MERLFYSSSPTLPKFHLKSIPFLPRLGRIDSPKPGFPPLPRAELRRVNSVSCKHENPSTPPTKLPSLSPLQSELLAGSMPKSNLFSQIANGVSLQQKFVMRALHPQSTLNPMIKERKKNPYTEASALGRRICMSAHKARRIVDQIRGRSYEEALAAAVGTFVVLSAMIMFLIHPIFAMPAFATFQTAAKTGGPAAAAVGAKLMRTELLSSAWTGFFAGCLHTLSGPDHLAALAPLSIGRTQMESAVVGALWGCGHDAGQVIFGLLFLLLKDRLHIEVIRTWGTRVVGFTLLVIGAMGIKEASEVPTPCVALGTGECDVSVYEALESPKVGKKKVGFATFATGIVHGLQPDALMMVLPALALPSRLAGVAFLIMFLFGTVVAMGSYTVFIGSCSQALKDRIPRITEKLTWASSLVAIALGLAIIISQFFGHSLY